MEVNIAFPTTNILNIKKVEKVLKLKLLYYDIFTTQRIFSLSQPAEKETAMATNVNKISTKK